MKISMDDVFPLMASAISGLDATEDERKDRAAYNFLADIRHFLCIRAGPGVVTQLQEFGLLLEYLLSNGDNDVHDLVQDSLEGLLECERRDSVARFFGPKTQELWTEVRKTVP